MLKLAHVSMFQASFFALWLLPLKWSVGAKIFVLIFGLYKLRNFSELKLTNLTSVFALVNLQPVFQKNIIFLLFGLFYLNIFIGIFRLWEPPNLINLDLLKFIIIWDFKQKYSTLCTILQTDLSKSYLFYKECIDKKWTFCS